MTIISLYKKSYYEASKYITPRIFDICKENYYKYRYIIQRYFTKILQKIIQSYKIEAINVSRFKIIIINADFFSDSVVFDVFLDFTSLR